MGGQAEPVADVVAGCGTCSSTYVEGSVRGSGGARQTSYLERLTCERAARLRVQRLYWCVAVRQKRIDSYLCGLTGVRTDRAVAIEPARRAPSVGVSDEFTSLRTAATPLFG